MTQHVIYLPLNLAHYYPAIHLFNLHHIAPSRHEGLLHITPLSRTVSPASSHAPRHRPGPQQLQLLPAKQRGRVHDVLHKGQSPLRPLLFSHPLTQQPQTVAERTPANQPSSVEENNYKAHVFVTSGRTPGGPGLAGASICLLNIHLERFY